MNCGKKTKKNHDDDQQSDKTANLITTTEQESTGISTTLNDNDDDEETTIPTAPTSGLTMIRNNIKRHLWLIPFINGIMVVIACVVPYVINFIIS